MIACILISCGACGLVFLAIGFYHALAELECGAAELDRLEERMCRFVEQVRAFVSLKRWRL